VPPDTCFSVRLPITIGKSSEHDLPLLEWHGMFSEHRELIREAFHRQENGEVLMLQATVNDFPVSQLWIDFARKKADSMGILWAFRVFPFLQRHGIGQMLLLVGESEAKKRGFRWAEVAVDETEPRAESLYLRAGYVFRQSVQDEYSYVSPSGATVRVQQTLRLFRKRLASEFAKPA
jgi:GNAT superfamily N-acetyltransferase